MKIGEYLTEYAKEKTQGTSCNNIKCLYYDNSETYMQNCCAGTRDDDSIVPYCIDYIPIKKEKIKWNYQNQKKVLSIKKIVNKIKISPNKNIL